MSVVMQNRPVMVNKFLMIHFMIGIIIGTCVLISVFIDEDPGAYIYPLSLCAVLLYVWCLWSWKNMTGNLFNPYILFLTAVMIFNAGQSFLYAFGLIDTYMNGYFTDATIEKSLLYISVSIYTLHFGAISVRKNVKPNKARDQLTSEKASRSVGWFLLAISITSAFIQLKQAIDIVLTSGYFGLFQRESIPTGLGSVHQVLASFLIPASMFLLAGSKNKRSTLLLATSIILGYSAIQFFLGSRSNAVMPLIAFLWLYDRSIKRIPRSLLVAFGSFLLFFVFPLISAIRLTVGNAKLSLATIVKSYFSIENPIVSILNEMGGSILATAHTINFVPYSRSFDLGKGYFYSFLTAFPNLFWEVHPSIAHGSYASWLVWQVDPSFAEIGGGFGYSVIAETFINFGWFGVIATALIGYLLTKFYYSAAKSNNIAHLAMVASFLSFFLFIARGESIAIVRPLLWYAFIPYLLFIVIYGHLEKNRSRYGQFENRKSLIKDMS